jgi:hypothetical protein
MWARINRTSGISVAAQAPMLARFLVVAIPELPYSATSNLQRGSEDRPALREGWRASWLEWFMQ